MKTKILLTCAGILSAAVSLAAEKAFVRCQEAKLYAQPSYKSSPVGTLQRGREVSVVGTDKNWRKVAAPPLEGWVMEMLLSAAAPVDAPNAFEQTGGESIQDKARKRASAIVTAGASRGLLTRERMRAGEETSARNYEELDRMDAMKFAPADALAFVKDLEAEEKSK